MDGAQSSVALPDDPVFSQTDNKYNFLSLNSLCSEFGINPNSDLRSNRGKNNGLGAVFVLFMREGPVSIRVLRNYLMKAGKLATGLKTIDIEF